MRCDGERREHEITAAMTGPHWLWSSFAIQGSLCMYTTTIIDEFDIYLSFFFISFEIASRLNIRNKKCIQDEWMETEINEPRLGAQRLRVLLHNANSQKRTREENVEADELFLKPQLLFFCSDT